MPPVPAAEKVQLTVPPRATLVLVWKLCHVPDELVANVTFMVWLVFASFMVAPTAGLSLIFVELLVGCSPVAVGQLFVQFPCVLNLYVNVWLQYPSCTYILHE